MGDTENVDDDAYAAPRAVAYTTLRFETRTDGGLIFRESEGQSHSP